jgi:hypothetical protein
MKPHEYITPQWLTIEGVHQYSGLSSNTIYKYLHRGHIVSAMVKLPDNRRGRRLINRTSLDAFIERFVVGTKREEDQQQRELLDLLAIAADAIAEARRIAAGVRQEKHGSFPQSFDDHFLILLEPLTCAPGLSSPCSGSTPIFFKAADAIEAGWLSSGKVCGCARLCPIHRSGWY